MAELVYEEILKTSENVKVDDEFKIGDLQVKVIKVQTNRHDDLVFDLEIVGATIKRRSKMMLILPKKVPVLTLK